MRYVSEQIVFQEVPGEISLAWTISGCDLRCPGCHSAETWAPDKGELLTPAYAAQRMDDYRGLISCVLFMGGEWHPDTLCAILDAAQSRGLATCLYTGLEDVSLQIKNRLTFLKTGAFIRALGGLDSPDTNQRFIRVADGKNLNELFRRTSHDQVKCSAAC